MTPQRSRARHQILRYSHAERVVHWTAALAYGYVLLTGLAF